jgi:hypothetical protein
MGPFSLTNNRFRLQHRAVHGKDIRFEGFVAVNNATDRAKTVDWALAPPTAATTTLYCY